MIYSFQDKLRYQSSQILGLKKARSLWLIMACSACSAATDSPVQPKYSQTNHTQAEIMPTSQSAPVAEPTQADEIFRDFFLNQLVPRFQNREDVVRAQDLVTLKRLPPSIKKQSFSSYKDQLVQTAGSSSLADFVIHGNITDLQKDGECWSVFYSGLLTGGVSGCIDSQTGLPVLVWITPEG